MGAHAAPRNPPGRVLQQVNVRCSAGNLRRYRNEWPSAKEPDMDVFRGTMRVANRTLEASVAAAGAVGGAAVQGVVGGVQTGLSSGSRSLPAAALTVAAVGAVGLVEWPVLLPVGATVLGVSYLAQRSGGERKRASTRRGSRPATKRSSAPRGS